jgi:hypothetical protein
MMVLWEDRRLMLRAGAKLILTQAVDPVLKGLSTQSDYKRVISG